MTRVGAVDCGTNTIKLLIADLPDPGTVHVHETRMVRLGEGVDSTGRLGDEALRRAFAAIDEYAVLIAQYGVENVRFCATSATRDAENAEDFRAGVLARIGVEPEVVSGQEEARLAFDGVARHLADGPSIATPLLVFDVGGGSTELILGEAHPTAAFSMDIGSVRLHERHVRHDPLTPDEVAAILLDVDSALESCPFDPRGGSSVVGVAGTVCTLAAGVLDLPYFDTSRIDRARIAVDELDRYVERLLAMTVEERRRLPYLHPGRADVIDAGALITQRVLARAGATELIASTADILHGIAWSIVEE